MSLGESTETFSVASVTTAYNAAKVLPRQLEALLRQTRKLQEIVVIDNASADDTARLLEKQYPQITVLPMKSNLGMAGAWAASLRYAALERRHDWVWTLDDDSVPSPDALETLISGAESVLAKEPLVGMVAALPVHAATGRCYPPQLWDHGWVKPSPEQLQQPVWFADLVYASGSLVRREVVERVGLPRPDFFMDFFDFEYCLRIRAHGYKIAVITAAKFAHEVGSAREVRLPGYSGLWGDHAPWREYYMTRNLVYAGWSLYPAVRTKAFVLRHLTRHAGGIVLFGANKLACLKRMAQGFWDGYRGRLGIRFLPV